MNKEDFYQWQDGVMEHSRMTQTLIKDRLALRELMTSHLKQFFDFDSIQYSQDFNRITLKWEYGNNPVINPEKLEELYMEFTISHEFSDKLGEGIRIDLYPFGFPEVD